MIVQNKVIQKDDYELCFSLTGEGKYMGGGGRKNMNVLEHILELKFELRAA